LPARSWSSQKSADSMRASSSLSRASFRSLLKRVADGQDPRLQFFEQLGNVVTHFGKVSETR